METIKKTFVSKVFGKITQSLDSVREHFHDVSSETIGWLAIVAIHFATIPTLLAMLTGLTDSAPPVDLVLAVWFGLGLFFIKATIKRDILNIITIGVGFFIQASLMALILFR